MWLEDYIPSEWVSEDWWTSAEQVKEVSEQYKKQAAKSATWIKRTQKDEKKAKTYDMLLAWFLVNIIVDDKFKWLLDDLIWLIHKWYPSNFILGIISLVYIDISNKIREIWKKEYIDFNYKSEIRKEFNDSTIDLKVKNRINLWIDDIVNSVSIEYSSILTKRLIWFLETQEDIIIFISKVFILFLDDINIDISLSKSQNISEFIISEVLNKIKKLKLDDI